MGEPLNPQREQLKRELFAEVEGKQIPSHIAIIMDGNGRWAKQHGLTRIRGHQMGARRVKGVVRFADKLGVRHITLYAFSVENWARPSFEVSALMRLIRTYIVKERSDLHAKGVRFRIIGRVNELAPEIIEEARISTELMKCNQGLSLNLCINYGGRAEIVDAVRALVAKGLKSDQITEEAIACNLYAPDLPDPDLIVRTSGEMRISNFLLWQCAYSELYVTEVLWPDFDDVELLLAVKAFQGRERRFGKTSEQMESKR